MSHSPIWGHWQQIQHGHLEFLLKTTIRLCINMKCMKQTIYCKTFYPFRPLRPISKDCFVSVYFFSALSYIKPTWWVLRYSITPTHLGLCLSASHSVTLTTTFTNNNNNNNNIIIINTLQLLTNSQLQCDQPRPSPPQ